MLGFSQPSPGSCPKKQVGFAISMLRWPTLAGVAPQGLGVRSGYGLPDILIPAVGRHGSWLLLRAPACCGPFATCLHWVFQDLSLGTKQLLCVQLGAGAAPASPLGRLEPCSFPQPCRKHQQPPVASKCLWLAGGRLPSALGAGEGCDVSKSRSPPR